MSFYIRNVLVDESVSESLLAEMRQNYVVNPSRYYSTIQSAIDAAHATGQNANIYVTPGTYNEDLTIYDKINVIGLMLSFRTIDNSALSNDVLINGTITLPASFVKGSIQSVALTAAAGSTLITSASAASTNTFFALSFVNIYANFALNVIDSSSNTQVSMSNCSINTLGYLFNSPTTTFYISIKDCDIYTYVVSAARGILCDASNTKFNIGMETTGTANNVLIQNSDVLKIANDGITNLFKYNNTSGGIANTFRFNNCRITGEFQTMNTSGATLKLYFANCTGMPTFNFASPSKVDNYIFNCSNSYGTTDRFAISKMYAGLNSSGTITRQSALTNQAQGSADIGTISFATANTTLYVKAEVHGNNGAGNGTFYAVLQYFAFDGTTASLVGSVYEDLLTTGAGGGSAQLLISGNVVTIGVYSPTANYNWTATYTYQFL